MDDVIYGIAMEHKKDDQRKICFNCASIYEERDVDILECPICGKTIQRTEYERIMGSIRPAVFSGWTCRRQYENNTSGKLYYTEPCGEILNFVAVAITSGLIGNITYDIIKKIITKIFSYIKSFARTDEDQRLVEFLNSSEKIKEFSNYLSAYYDEFEGVDDITKSAIREEVFADQMSEIMDRLIKKHHAELDVDRIKMESPYSEKDIMKMMLEIRNDLRIYKIEKADFENMWKDLK